LSYQFLYDTATSPPFGDITVCTNQDRTLSLKEKEAAAIKESLEKKRILLAEREKRNTQNLVSAIA
jgi:hypothetical protein